MKKAKRITIWAVVVAYFIIIIGYCLGKAVAGNAGLEYRFWVEALFRIIVWFVPALFIGVLLLLGCIRKWKKKSGYRWVLTAVLILYSLAAAYLSLWYFLFNIFSLATDEKMPDGNLVVTVPYGMESDHYYAEPMGLFLRRRLTLRDEQLAESISRIYNVDFQARKADDGETVFVSDAYPDIEVKILRFGYSINTYIDTDLEYVLTSRRLEKHREIFDENGVELVPYAFGKTEMNPEGHGTYQAVLITDDNQEDAATAIAEFIQTTLKEEMREDGKSCWESVDGSIFLVIKNEETGEVESVRNIPFSLRPEYFWVFDESVTAEEVSQEIAEALD